MTRPRGRRRPADAVPPDAARPYAAPPDTARPYAVPPDAVPDVALLVDVATRIWRARRHAGRLAEPSRPLSRELDAALAALTAGGLVVQEHDGCRFEPGLALIAVVHQPVAGLDHELVLDTLRPSVYLGGRQVQRGEVVVGVPEAPEPPQDPGTDHPAGGSR